MLTTYLGALRQINRNVRLFLISVALLGFTVSGGIYPVLFNLYLLRLGYGLDFVGLFNATGALTFALCSLPVGMLCRRWGSRPMLILGLTLIVVSNVVLPLVEFAPTAWRTATLMCTRVPNALGFALYIVNANPFLMNSTTRQERTHVFSLQIALWPLAGFAGSLVGGFLPGFFAALLGLSLDSSAAFRYPLLLGATLLVPGILALVATRETEEEHPRETTNDTSPLPLGPIIFIALVLLLQTACMGGVQTFFNVYLERDLQVSTVLIGTLFAAGQLVGGVAALTTPLLSARWGHTRIIIWGSVGTGFSLLPLILIGHWAAAGIGFVGVSALASLRVPALLVYQQEMMPRRWRAVMSGAANMASGLSFSATTLSGGYIIPALGYPSLCLMVTGLMMVGTLVFWAYFRTPRGEYARDSAIGPPA